MGKQSQHCWRNRTAFCIIDYLLHLFCHEFHPEQKSINIEANEAGNPTGFTGPLSVTQEDNFVILVCKLKQLFKFRTYFFKHVRYVYVSQRVSSFGVVKTIYNTFEMHIGWVIL